MFDLQPPRHISTLPCLLVAAGLWAGSKRRWSDRPKACYGRGDRDPELPSAALFFAVMHNTPPD
jgi:hypothetical protein